MLKKICLYICLMAATRAFTANELQRDIDTATSIIHDFKAMPEKSIPEDILKDAKGLAILNIIKAGFFFSGRGGIGLVVARTSHGWSAPSAVGVGGAGFGFQIGAEVTDFVLVLNTDEAVDAFANGTNVALGVNVSMAAGPVGRTAEGGVMPKAAIYTYSRSQGLFAGVSLEGTIIGERKETNREFYKKPYTAAQLLSGSVPEPKSAEKLYAELNAYTH